MSIEFDDVTTIIGPNGVGKSSILRALDWFFNGAAQTEITIQDLSPGADGQVRVEVEFDGLTASDRDALGRYAPEGSDRVLLWKTWQDGAEIFSGNAKSLAEFGSIRQATSAAAKKDLYKALREGRPDLDLPVANTGMAVDAAMVQWETGHPDQLSDSEVQSTTRFFGFLGGAKLSGIFDYVFVSADLRASEEATDARNATIGRLLERAVDRTVVSAEIDVLLDSFNAQRAALVAEKLGDDLVALGEDLSTMVGQLTSGRTVSLQAESTPVRVPPVLFRAQVTDGAIHTDVAGQGHGFQRALLVAALRMVAERGHVDGTTGTILLAIEEPELYQHPAQARALAATLRALAGDALQAMQVLYATHSPLFIEPGQFHQLRRMGRVDVADGDGSAPHTEIQSGNRSQVAELLAPIMGEDAVQKQIDKACPVQLAEAVFADAVVLVEGETDKAVLDAMLQMDSSTLTKNISIVDVSGKGSLPLCWAVLSVLGIHAIMIADTDSHRQLVDGEAHTEKQVQRQQQATQSNHRLMKAAGVEPQDWPPQGQYSDGDLVFLDPNLESVLQREWHGWEEKRLQLVAEEAGHDGKHALTYFRAALEAAGDAPPVLGAVIVRLLEFTDGA